MKRIAVLCAGLALAGCVNISESEMALSQNVYRIDLNARGRFGVDAAPKRAQVRAAELTIAKGYTHYIIQNSASQGGTVYAGSTPVYATTTVNVIGNSAFANTSTMGGYPMMMPTSTTSIIVAMFKAPNVPPGALDASKMLASFKK